MAQLIAGAIGGPAAAQAVAAYSASRGDTPQAPQLADASSMLVGPPPSNADQGTQMAQAQQVDNSNPQQQAPAAPFFGVDSQQPQQAAPPPVDNPYADDTPQQLANDIGTPTDQQPIDVRGDSWQPHKESVLAQIGDFLLQRRGMQPLFKNTNDRHNLTAALQGMQQDPEQTISRVRKFNPDLAYKMQQNYDTLHKDDDERAAKMEIYKGQLQERMANAIGSIKTPEGYAKVLPVLQQQAERLGIPAPPDKYDPDLINAYRYQGYKTKDQVAQQSTNDYRGKRLGQLQESITNTQNYRGARLGQMNSSQDEQTRHDKAMENKTGAQKGPRYVGTKYGPGVLSKDGYKMQVNVGGTTHTYLNVGPNKWKLQQEDDDNE